MRALSTWQPWATLIAEGVKPWEFRKRAAPPAIVGKRIVVHAALRKVRLVEIDDLLASLRSRARGFGLHLDVDRAIPLLERIRAAPDRVPLGCGVCTAILAASTRVLDLPECAAAPAELRAEIDPDKFGWRLDAVERMEPPVPCRGERGFWKWPMGEPA